ncbi:hypothetical protein AB6A40_004082 [Gnathostoma spinigerum]|uniref:Endoplasmic reticulum lectin 1 n=1 Tax=Gnathostoma spinigerum TaxID=75299 RepID=A0ABD6EBL2_9BILA
MRKKVEKYSGPSPADLVKSLYDERVCSYRLEPYWTYEICHGRYVLQYHEDHEIRRNEFYLGNFRWEQTRQDDKDFDELNPKKRKIDDKDLPYYPVIYRQGTVCDITGKPRTITVMYVCLANAKNQVYSLSEVSSCTYEAIILTNRLCSHPSFRPIAVKENEIICYSTDQTKTSPKPLALAALEKEQSEAIENEYIISAPPNFPTHLVSNEDIDDGDDDDDSDTTVILPKDTSHPDARYSEGSRHPSWHFSSDSSDKSGQENAFILNGKHCIYGGGSGWWKYEFCYGEKVIQFHDDPGKGRTEILLGLFNKEIHKHWMAQNPHKRPVKVNGQVIQISQFYGGGDVCAEENIHRSVEVRIRCRTTQGSQSAVTLYLLEPHTCRYILGVESPAFCALLQNVDEEGLLPPIMSESSSKNAEL